MTDQEIEKALEAYRAAVAKTPRPEVWVARPEHIAGIKAALETLK